MGNTQKLGKLVNGLTVLDNGNVGVGNTNPSYTLDVSGTGRFSGANYLFRLDGGATSRIAGTIGNTSGVLDWGLEGSAGGQLFTGAGAYSGNIGTSSATSFNLCSNSTVRATITSAGNVGINSNSPAFKLDVADAGSVISGTATIGSNMKGIRIFNTTSAVNNNAVGLWFSTGPHQAGIASFRATADTTWETSLAFYTHIDTTSNLTDATEKMRISGQGYVTMPYQPSFFAASSLSAVSFTGGTVIVFNTTKHNTGSHYNTSTGRFTVPVTGKYLFSVNIYMYTSYTTSITLTINGSQYSVADTVPLLYKDASISELTSSFVVIYELSANDYVEVRARAGYSIREYMGHSHFTGQLLS